MPTTLADLLRLRAAQPQQHAGYVFLDSEGEPGTTLSYRDLERAALRIARRLRAAGIPERSRAVLLHPPGPDFLAAFFGCQYAGVVAVPTVPPDPARLDRTLPRLLSTMADAQPLVGLTTTDLLPLAEEIARREPSLVETMWLASDVTDADDEPVPAEWWSSPEVAGSDVAFLQYTSGSTGSPKGVMLSHANLLHNSRLIHEFFRTDTGSRGMSWLPPYHDMGLIGGLLQPLYVDFPIWLMSPIDFMRDPMKWLAAASRHAVTVTGGPNFAYDLCVRKSTPQQRADLDLSAWDVAFNGAEPVRQATLNRFAEAFAVAGFRRRAFFPCYGLAEATLIVSGKFEGTGDDASCGQWAPDQRVEIVDPQTRRRVGPGDEGEVWVHGPSVGLGYWGQQSASAETFRAQLADEDGPTFLRTGDLGRLWSGELVLTGRLKDVMVIRGRNHYPQDLEATADQAHPSIRPGGAAAFQLEPAPGDERPVIVLEASVSPGSDEADTVVAAVRRAVAAEHGIQIGRVVLIEPRTLPKTSSGKVQRIATRQLLLDDQLAEIACSTQAQEPASGPGSVTEHSDARESGEIGRALRRHVSELCALSFDQVRPDHPLLANGLDSLGAQELRQRVEADFGVRLPLALVLGDLPLQEVADRIAHLAAEPSQPDPVPAATEGVTEPAPGAMTLGQQALWLQHRWANSPTSAFTTATAFRVTGHLDVEALRRAFTLVANRHPSLRSTFHEEDGSPVRVVGALSPEAVTVIDASSLTEVEVAAKLADEANRPFNLAVGPLVRLRVVLRSPGESIIQITAHHLVVDFWSTLVLGRELAAAYDEEAGGPAADLPDPTEDSASLAAHEREELDSARGAADRRYWEEQCARATALPDRVEVLDGDGATHRFRLEAELVADLKERAATSTATVTMLLLAAFQAVLHRRTAQESVTVGLPLAARDRPGRPGAQEVVGLLMNLVPVHSRFDPTMSFDDLLRQARGQVLGAVEHQTFPVTLLSRRFPSVREAHRNVFVFNQPGAEDAEQFPEVLLGHAGVARSFGSLRAESIAVDLDRCGGDLELSMSEIDGVIHGIIRSDRGSQHDAAALLSDFVTEFVEVLRVATADPEAARLHADASPLSADTTVARLIRDRALRQPDAPAVINGDRIVTYRALAARADGLATKLAAHGVGPGRRIGVLMNSGPNLYAALLAVLTSGAGVVPLDPANPSRRIAAVIADAAVSLVLSEPDLAGKMLDPAITWIDATSGQSAPEARPGAPCQPRALDPGYVFYTSGSTGRPKGVELSHQAITNQTLHACGLYRLDPCDRVLQFASPGFDASIEEILTSLASGSCLIPRTDHMLESPAVFLRSCAEMEVTVLDLPTSYWHDVVRALIDREATMPATVRLVIVGGETLLPERLRAWQEVVGGSVRLVNTYGPTETTVIATAADLDVHEGQDDLDFTSDSPIGRAVAGKRAHVLDSNLRPVARGAVGELYLGGIGLANGYLNQPSQTAERFVADPFGRPGARLYRSGDLVRRLTDDSLAFVERADRQLKINGYRIEPAEVETVLRSLDGVEDAVVLPHENAPTLAAYVTGANGVTAAHDLRDRLRALLPPFLVPTSIAAVPALPRTINGKIDHAALRASSSAAHPNVDGPAGGEAPDGGEPSDHERLLAEIWCAVLDVPRVRRHDDFFELGGHSLLATKVLARIRERTGCELPLNAFFEDPTLAGLAGRLEAAADADADPPIGRCTDEGPRPLSFVQERIWFLQQLDPESTNYNVARAVRLRGRLDVDAVRRAVNGLEERHEILRTTFPDVDGDPYQLVHPPRGFPLTIIDASDLPEQAGQDQESWLEGRILGLGGQPFDLAEWPMVRAQLIELGEEDHVLIMVEHHVVHDGWAQGVLLRDFLEFYQAATEGRAADLPELPIQYGDFAAWQRERICGEHLERLLTYWRERLAGAPAVLDLPTDRPRPEILGSAGGAETLRIDADLAQDLMALGREHQATPFMTAYAVFTLMLHAVSGAADIVVGSGVANRNRPELDNLLGMMVNTLPLRTDLSGDPPFHRLLDRIRENSLADYAHQDMPLDLLVRDLRPARSLNHNPLFQVMFSFLDTPMPDLLLPGVEVEVLDAHNRSAKCDLNAVVITEADRRMGTTPETGTSGEMAILLEYNTELFDPTTIRTWLRYFEVLTRAAVADPTRTVADLVAAVGDPSLGQAPMEEALAP